MATLKPLRSSEGLPLPRLQITWVKHPQNPEIWFAIYEIIIPSTPLDVRVTDTPKERELPPDGEPLWKGGHLWSDDRNIYIRMSITRVTTGARDMPFTSGELDLPFRDGAHIAWDAFSLNMRAFIVYGMHAQEIEPKKQAE
jgi:hypothetical protein